MGSNGASKKRQKTDGVCADTKVLAESIQALTASLMHRNAKIALADPVTSVTADAQSVPIFLFPMTPY